MTPHWTMNAGEYVCAHGTAIDIHCCNCHSGFLFNVDTCVCGRVVRLCACGCEENEHDDAGRCLFCGLEDCQAFTYDPEGTLLRDIMDLEP